MGFVPVNFSAAHRPVRFPPAPAAVSFPESLQPPDAPSGRDDLDVRDVSDDFEHPLSTVTRVRSGANRHVERGNVALHVASLREVTTVVNVAQTGLKAAASAALSPLLFRLVDTHALARVNAFSGVLWLEAWTLDFPSTARIPERAEVVRQEPGCRSSEQRQSHPTTSARAAAPLCSHESWPRVSGTIPLRSRVPITRGSPLGDESLSSLVRSLRCTGPSARRQFNQALVDRAIAPGISSTQPQLLQSPNRLIQLSQPVTLTSGIRGGAAMILRLALMLVLSQQASSAATTQELERIEQQLAETWKAGDCSGWGAMLAPDWSVIHITGAVITKVEALKMCNAPRQTGEDYRVDDLSVRAFGDAAVVTGRTRVTTGGANPGTLTLRFTDVFVRRDGRWQVVASHATRLGS